MPKRTEIGDWTRFFGLLTQLAPSPAIREAAQRVFGTPSIVGLPKQETADPSLLALTRLLMLQRFEVVNAAVKAAHIYGVLRIHKSDWYKWRRGELPDSSIITKRIECYLTKV